MHSTARHAHLAPPDVDTPAEGVGALRMQFVPPARSRFVLFKHDRSRLSSLTVTFLGAAGYPRQTPMPMDGPVTRSH
jgi:hypothetical protein